ncbi:MAG TPA: hypothetical protein VNH19_17615 [Candidatus Limnocylindrales bacterium]|nr:hypothetical protein [Candidatus Limnocylindrales bacterium]
MNEAMKDFWKPKRLPEFLESNSIDELIERLDKHQYDSQLIHTCFVVARQRNLNREQTYALLAYHAVRLYEQMFDKEVERKMTELPAPFILQEGRVR